MPNDLRQTRRAVDAAADAVAELLNGGALRIYDGTRPRTADNAPGALAVRLVEFAFADPAFGSAQDGEATALPLAAARAIANGSPTWFRALSADGRAVFDGSVGLAGSRADLELPVATIVAGAEVVLTSFVYTQPRGG